MEAPPNPKAPVARLLDLAGKQHGSFATRQATMLGVTGQQLAAMVRDGLIRRRRRGLYEVVGSSNTPERRTMEAVLAGPSGCLASHESAAHLLGLLPAPAEVHVTVGPDQRLRLDGVVAHRSPVAPAHRAKVGAIPVTSLARTVVDLASVSDLARLADVVDPLLVAKRLRPAQLLGVIDDIVDAPGRHGTALLRNVLDVWRQPMRPDSAAEVRLLRRLDEHGFGGYVTQHEVTVDSKRLRLDVAWPDERVLLEYSGKDHHGPRRWGRDERRATGLERLGWAYREVDAADLVPGDSKLWSWLAQAFRRAA